MNMPPKNLLTTEPPDTSNEDSVTSTSTKPVDTIEDPLIAQVTSPNTDTVQTTGAGPPGGKNPLVDGLQKSMTEGDKKKKGRGKEGTDLGREKYEALLGKWLGGKTYTAMAPHLTLSKLQGYAGQAVEGAIPSLKDALKGIDSDGNVDTAKLDAFAAILLEQSKAGADSWLASDDGKAAEKMAAWVDKHPFWVTTIAVAAAATYVLTNQDIPELDIKKIKLGDDISIDLGAKLGKTMEMALEKIELQIQIAAAQLSSKYERKVDQNENEGTETLTETGSAGLAFKDKVTVTDAKGKESEKSIDRLKATVGGKRTSEGAIDSNDKETKSYEVTAGLTALLGKTGEDSLSMSSSNKTVLKDNEEVITTNDKLGYKGKSTSFDLSNAKSSTNGELTEDVTTGKLSSTLSKGTKAKAEVSQSTKKDDTGDMVTTNALSGDLRRKKTSKGTDGKDVVLSDSGISGKIEQSGDDILLYDINADLMALIDRESGTSIGANVGASQKEDKDAPTFKGGITIESGGTTQTSSIEKTGNALAFKNTVKGVSEGITTQYSDESASDGSSSTDLSVKGKGDNGISLDTKYAQKTTATEDGTPGSTTESGSANVTYEDENTKLSFGGGADSEGNSNLKASIEQSLGDGIKFNAGYEQALKNEKVDSGYKLTDTRLFNMGLNLKRDELDLALKGSMGTYNGDLQALKASAKLGTESGFTTSANFGYSRPIEDLKLSDQSLLEVGAAFGFKDSSRFRSYLLEYSYNSELDQQTFGLKIEEQLKKFKVRMDTGLKYTGTADGIKDPSLMFNSGVLGAYQLGDKKNKNALLMGVNYMYDNVNGSQVVPRIGMQIKGMPVTVDWNIQQKTFNLNLVVKKF
jgi:hypothetical protein